MFKQLSAYRLAPGGLPGHAAISAGLDKARFAPCAPTQPVSMGWVAPRGDEHAPLLESVAGQWLAQLRIEQRLLPGSVVRDRTLARAAQIEREIGRKPGKRALRELKDEATFELLPQAFTKQATVLVWIDPAAGWLLTDAGSQARIDATLTALVQAAEGLAPMALHTELSPPVAMRDWLASGEPPRGFSVDRDCELKAPDETRAVVRYTRHALDPADLKRHLDAGMMPSKLALTWGDRVSFVLTDALQLKRIALLDVVMDGHADAGFDADVALATGELKRLLPELLDALGGLVTADPFTAAPAATAAQAA
jgi:recombination associated protein RdgC